MRYKFEGKTMTNKMAITSLLCCLLTTVGCVTKSYYDGERVCDNGVCTSNQEYTAVCIENADGYSECSDSSNVNYTRTAAQFRQYGERTPRDHRITQAGAGNNISAAVPPSINDEVIEYQNQVQFGNGSVPEIAMSQNDVPPVSDNGGSDRQDWLAEEGQSLKELLTTWSDEAGWRLIWKTNRNYTLNAGAMFRGNFADVSSALVRAFARARPAPVATFYKGNRVLVIETMEDENAYD